MRAVHLRPPVTITIRDRSKTLWAITVFGLFTAVVHLLLNTPFRIEYLPFSLSGLGYLALWGVFFFNPSGLEGNRQLLLYAFIGYAAVTVVVWVFLGKPYSVLGYVSKVDEVLLILALCLHSRGLGRTAVARAVLGVLGAVVVSLLGLAAVIGTLYIVGRTTVYSEAKAGGIIVEMNNTQFQPAQLNIPAGETARLVVKNRDYAFHTFTIPELRVNFTFSPRDEKLVE